MMSLTFEALARGDRVAADVLVKCSRLTASFVLEPDVLAALRVLFQGTRVGLATWEVLLAQLRSRFRRRASAQACAKGDDDEEAEQRDDEAMNGNTSGAGTSAGQLACSQSPTSANFSATIRDDPFMSVELPLLKETRASRRCDSVGGHGYFFVNQICLAFGKPASRSRVARRYGSTRRPGHFWVDVGSPGLHSAGALQRRYLHRSRNRGRVRLRNR